MRAHFSVIPFDIINHDFVHSETSFCDEQSSEHSKCMTPDLPPCLHAAAVSFLISSFDVFISNCLTILAIMSVYHSLLDFRKHSRVPMPPTFLCHLCRCGPSSLQRDSRWLHHDLDFSIIEMSPCLGLHPDFSPPSPARSHSLT
jgi:hypothetical protein